MTLAIENRITKISWQLDHTNDVNVLIFEGTITPAFVDDETGKVVGWGVAQTTNDVTHVLNDPHAKRFLEYVGDLPLILTQQAQDAAKEGGEAKADANLARKAMAEAQDAHAEVSAERNSLRAILAAAPADTPT